jgi:DNA-binding NarL/FixJ family response regulator
MSGMDTLAKIVQTNRDFDVIILSREKNPELIQKFIEKGAKKYVIKDDYFIDTLIDTIENHFS